ncbi:TPR domain-containing protein [Brachyspira intermedia PWS/A]|uniref:TPR domain-containing protein n=1 Tax=Brachyspira intermedia (strain ATCC 51140 / PWS/A) TaxID=1045858 RepID=G0EQ75_BRAIP|nr:tetratricopeptide repeat protein [Brachyspira intermedia]AEM23333.1 TPR domain-containing protein [Brachyspira intermedia PWS/A]
MKKSNENTSLKYLELAKEKEEIGEYKEALEYYEKSIEEDPDNIEAYFGLNLINSYIEMEKELKNDDASDNINKHIEFFNIFNEFLNKK